MLDIAWPEVIVIGAVALVVIGPEDMPKVMRALGRLAGKARDFATDIRNNFEQLTAEAELMDHMKRGEGVPNSDPLKEEEEGHDGNP